jgi:hypothetical protein
VELNPEKDSYSRIAATAHLSYRIPGMGGFVEEGKPAIHKATE